MYIKPPSYYPKKLYPDLPYTEDNVENIQNKEQYCKNFKALKRLFSKSAATNNFDPIEKLVDQMILIAQLIRWHSHGSSGTSTI